MKELQPNAKWRKIQQDTFTRWVNKHLSSADVQVSNLETDFEEGLNLIRLVEVLSGKKLERYSKKVTFCFQKLENISLALDFLQKEEHIKLINIDSSDIAEGNLKLILGLIWTLILHYSIAGPIYDDHPSGDVEIERSPKEKLMSWIKKRLPSGLPLNNFTSDWNDGVLLGALVDSWEVGLDWRSWVPEHSLESTRKAMQMANDCLGIHPLITPEELISPAVDEKSVMTYLSQFPQATYRPPLGRISEIDSPVIIDSMAHFVLETTYPTVEYEVSIYGPDSTYIRSMSKKVMSNKYEVTFIPQELGEHQIKIFLKDHASSKSTELVHKVNVVKEAKVIFEPGAQIDKKVDLQIVNADGNVEVVVVDPNGGEVNVPVIVNGYPPVTQAEYVPQMNGLHLVHVYQNKQHISGSPFALVVEDPIQIWGRGIMPDEIRSGEEVFFCTNTGLNDEHLQVVINEPFSGTLPVKRLVDKKGIAYYIYRPMKEGVHEIFVRNRYGQNVGKSPYSVRVGPKSISNVRAIGPGLEKGIAKTPSYFFVQTNGEVLNFSMEGPGKTDLSLKDYGDGSALVTYTPKEEGIYMLSIKSQDFDIPNSPFIVLVEPENKGLNLHKVHLDGISAKRCIARGRTFTFILDASKLEGLYDRCEVEILDSSYNPVEIHLLKKSDGIYECSFVPEKAGRFFVIASVNGAAVANTPFTVRALDINDIRVHGPGIGSHVHTGERTYFVVDANGAASSQFDVVLKNAEGRNLDLDVVENNDGTITVKYTAPKSGLYQLKIAFAGVEMSPIDILVKTSVDISEIKVEGLESESVLILHRRKIRINIGTLQASHNGLEVIIEDPRGKKCLLKLLPDLPNVYTGTWVAEEIGLFRFTVYFDAVLVKQSEIVVNPGYDASKCRAHGAGLEQAIVNEPSSFYIDTQGAGEGLIAMQIRGPTESKTSMKDNLNGSCTVEYVPLKPGLYEITLMFGNERKEIPGSPFTVVADYRFDPSKILINGYTGEARIGSPTIFTIDATRTAASPIHARLPATQQQPIVEEVDSRLYQITFTASGKLGDEIPMDILYAGDVLNNRPLIFKLLPEDDTGEITVRDKSGDESPEIVASRLVEVFIEQKDIGRSMKILSVVKAPDGRMIPSTVRRTSNVNVVMVQFTPYLSGVYIVQFYIDDVPLNPVHLTAQSIGEADKCSITINKYIDYWGINEEVKLSVNTKNAGNGEINVVASRDEDVDVTIESKDSEKVIKIVPKALGRHEVSLFYGGKLIPEGSFRFECVEAKSDIPVRDLVLYRTADFEESDLKIYKSEVFSFSIGGDTNFDYSKLRAIVTMPTGKKDFAVIEDNHDGTVSISYLPTKTGRHLLSVQHDGVNLVGSPMSFYVDVVNNGPVTLYGLGLSQAVVGEPAAFTICTKDSGVRGLSVSISGAAKATIQCHDNKDGTCSVVWVPPVPGEYQIHVKVGEKAVKDSPFKVFVAGEGQKRAHLSIGSTCEASLSIVMSELKGLSASIKSPSGIEEPCVIRHIDSSHIGVSFTPRESGDHLVTVKKDGRVLPKSPFKVKVDNTQVGDASKVIVSGPGRADAICQQYNDFSVDTRKAGYGGLSVSLEGPSKAELMCKEAKDGIIKISYRPTEPGIYILSVKFADIHVKDSPFTVNCTGQGIGAVREVIKRHVPQASMVLPGQDAMLFLQLSNTSPMEMTSKVMKPSGQTEDVEMRDLGGNFYQIKFKPESEGAHAVSVYHRDQHVAGSPFQYTVGHFADSGSHRVRAAGVGLLRAETNFKQSFNVYTREAGKGDLEVIVEGPSKAELELHEHKDGGCHVDYKVSKPGEYQISILFNNAHIPDSPFKVFVAPATGEARRLELASFPDSGQPGKACTFTVLTHRAPGNLEAKVHTPSNTIETIDIVPVDEGESYALRFIPHETGNYYIDITLDGAPMRDSPFRLRIGSREENDPTAITVSGDGIRSGTTGQKCEFIISTLNAGSGLLQVQMDGPSKVTLDAYELSQGYKVRYTALAPGIYYATVKYSGVHIPGSPFKIPIEGNELGGSGEHESSLIKIDALAKTSKGTAVHAPTYKGDASKVTAAGSGLNKFFPGRPAMFNIDAGLAGDDLLFVGVVTTKGPCEEVIVKHQGHGQYIVSYRIQERNKGFIFVKYGNEQIPGSPFAISF